MTQSGWPTRLTGAIAGEVRHCRKERGMSAQQLADRCGRLGMEISRATITDLENGRRAAISVAELLVLAAALEVPPILLVAPLTGGPQLEILPGMQASGADVARWFRGNAALVHDGERGQFVFDPETDQEKRWIKDIADRTELLASQLRSMAAILEVNARREEP